MTSLEDAQKKFVELLDSVKGSNVAEFLSWIEESFTTSEPTGGADQNDAIATIHAIASELRSKDQLLCWQFLKQNIKSGAVIVSHPAIENVTKHLPLGFALNDWVNQISTEQLAAKFAGTNTDLYEDCAKICLYQVK
uniref:Uncharacterized protein n=1 Tax=Plectus sambesii TaxID=2011161 RepID=A0A914X560_9BILA